MQNVNFAELILRLYRVIIQGSESMCRKALYVHCCAHSLNLALQDTTRSVTTIRDVLDHVKELVNVIRASAKRHAVFEKIRATLAGDASDKIGQSLRPLCPTRWAVRATSMSSVVENFDAVLQTLDTLSAEDKTEIGSKAAGLIKCFTGFTTFFALKLGIVVFEKAELLSCLLQKKSITATAAKRAAEALVADYRKLRDDVSFQHF